jgi:hypothetical protein
MSKRNITLSLSDELIRDAKVLAAQHDTSVSSLVGQLLAQLVGDLGDYDQAWAAEEAVMKRGALVVGEITWNRDELHAR